jgi:hypothetical protein
MDLVYEMASSKASSDELAANPGKYLLCARGSYGTTKLLSHVGSDSVELVWSLWRGYWKREGCATRAWAERENVQAHFVHSGGHAWPEDLERLRVALRPLEHEFVHSVRP